MEKVKCVLINLAEDEYIIDHAEYENSVPNLILAADVNLDIPIDTSIAIKERANIVTVRFFKETNMLTILSSADFYNTKKLDKLCAGIDSEIKRGVAVGKNDYRKGDIYVIVEISKFHFVSFKSRKYILDSPDVTALEIRKAIRKYAGRIKSSLTDIFKYKNKDTNASTYEISYYDSNLYSIFTRQGNIRGCYKEDIDFINMNAESQNKIPAETIKTEAKSVLHKPDTSTTISLRKIFNYKLKEFMVKFKTTDDLLLDVEKYLSEYITFGITYDKVHIVINYLNECIVKSEKGPTSSHDRKIVKELRVIVKHMEQIKFTYNVRANDYVQVRCPHERTGHWRKYKSGKKTWVDKCYIHKNKVFT